MSQLHYKNVKTGKTFTCSKSQWESMMKNPRIRGRIIRIDPPKSSEVKAETEEKQESKSTPTPPEAKEAEEEKDTKKSKSKSKS